MNPDNALTPATHVGGIGQIQKRSALPTGSVEPRKPEVSRELDTLHTKIGILRNILEVLVSRISPIIVSRDALNRLEKESNNEPVASVIGSSIREASHQIQKLIIDIEQVINSVEL